MSTTQELNFDFDLMVSTPTMGVEVQHATARGPRTLWLTTSLEDGDHLYTRIESDIYQFRSWAYPNSEWLSAELRYHHDREEVEAWIWKHHPDAPGDDPRLRELVGHLQPDGEIAILCATFPENIAHLVRPHPGVRAAQRRVQQFFGAWTRETLNLEPHDGGYIYRWTRPEDSICLTAHEQSA